MPVLPWWSYWIAAFITLLVLGFASLVRKLMRTIGAMDYLQEYEQHYSDVIDLSKEDDEESRTWLITNAEKMMSLMGAYGALYSQMTGHINLAIKLVPDICFEFGRMGVPDFVLQERVNAASKALLIFRGSLCESYESQKGRLKNPLRWLSEGISLVLRIPILIANSVGLFTESHAKKITNSRFWELLSGFASLATIAGFILELLIRTKAIP